MTKKIKVGLSVKNTTRDAIIKTGFLAGKTIKQITNDAACSPSTASRQCRKLSVSMNIPMPSDRGDKYAKRDAIIKKGFDDGMVIKQIAFEAGCTGETVRTVLKGISVAFAAKCAKRNALIKRGFLAGETIKQITLSSGCCVDTVRPLCRKLSVSMNIPMPCTYEVKYAKRDAIIKNGVAAGNGTKQIAFEAGCTPQTINNLYKRGWL
jgi:hypothetical protein